MFFLQGPCWRLGELCRNRVNRPVISYQRGNVSVCSVIFSSQLYFSSAQRYFFTCLCIILYSHGIRIIDSKFEPTGTAPGPKSGPAGLFAGPNMRLLDSCWALRERLNAKGICCQARYWSPRWMLGLMLAAGPIQKICCADSVPGPDFGEY